MSNMFYIAQIFGICALICWLKSVLQKDKKTILKCQNLANIFYAIQYTLLGAYPAAGTNLISTLRGLVFYENDKKGKETSLAILILFIIIIAVVGLGTYQNIFSLLPLVITALYSYSIWQKNLTIFRIIFVIAACGWIVYNFHVGAYISLIGNFFELTFGLLSLSKYDLQFKKN